MALMLRCGDRWHAAVVAAVVRAAFAAVVSLLRDFCVTIFHHVSTFSNSTFNGFDDQLTNNYLWGSLKS